MKCRVKAARLVVLLVPALALAAPAFAQVRPPTLSDSQEPGSVIVFPKFVQGTVGLPEGPTAPITELEIGVVCPKSVACPEHEPVKIRFHWVCGATITPTWVSNFTINNPASNQGNQVQIGNINIDSNQGNQGTSTTNSAVDGIQANAGINGGVGNTNVAIGNEQVNVIINNPQANLAGSFTCRETDFDVTATVWEKIVLVPDGTVAGSTGAVNTKTVPAANCPNGGGYLIGWMISPTNDQPIKFDGLTGDAVLRAGATADNPMAGSPTAQAGYSAIPIQADPALANGAAITTNGNGALLFDGGAGHYLAVSGQVLGDVTYANLTTGPTFARGILTLLTLDVKSNRPNNPVFVDLDFFGGNPSAIGNENQLSTTTEFICWEEIAIDQIDPNLTTTLMGREGVVASDQAKKVGLLTLDDTGPTTLLGLSETLEGGVFPPTAPWPRASFSGLFNSSVPVPTHFLPTPSPNFLP